MVLLIEESFTHMVCFQSEYTMSMCFINDPHFHHQNTENSWIVYLNVHIYWHFTLENAWCYIRSLERNLPWGRPRCCLTSWSMLYLNRKYTKYWHFECTNAINDQNLTYKLHLLHRLECTCVWQVRRCFTRLPWLQVPADKTQGKTKMSEDEPQTLFLCVFVFNNHQRICWPAFWTSGELICILKEEICSSEDLLKVVYTFCTVYIPPSERNSHIIIHYS